MSSLAPAIVWFRRDLRLRDHPALAAAARAGGGRVVALFVVDERLLAPAGPTRAAYLAATVRELDRTMGGRLVVRVGDPAAVVPALAREVGAPAVWVSEDFGPQGRRRDERVAAALAAEGRELRSVDSPYVVAPGVVRGPQGNPYRVFTPFFRAWDEIALDIPVDVPDVEWIGADGTSADEIVARSSRRRPEIFGDLPDGPAPLAPAGEAAARAALAVAVERARDYEDRRDALAEEGTSRLSAHLRFGTLHPRTVLAALGPGPGPRALRRQLAWREFYADVLFHHPASAWRNLQPTLDGLEVDRDGAARERLRCWARGETGVPLVDAAMRQLLEEGWMHNRARMVSASFLVKHLHLDWRWGARWFAWRLVDFDLASNQHGWQWTAGTGTDAAPFHRVFSPVRQAERFDPEGAFIRRYVGELATVEAPECWSPGAAGYRHPVVDLDVERREALARFAAARGRRP